MDFKVLSGLLLLALAITLTGCATTNDSADDATPPLEPSPTHDDSHGWGANLQNTSH